MRAFHCLCLIVGFLFCFNSFSVAITDDTATSPTSNLAENIIVRCWGPGLYNTRTQNYIFMIEYFHFMEQPITPKWSTKVTKLDGTELLKYPTFIEPSPIPPDYSVNWWIFFFEDLWETGHRYGFIKITVDMEILDDGSITSRTFYGYAWYPFVKIFYVRQLPDLFLPE